MAGYKFNKNEDPTMKKLFSIAILFLCPFVIAEDDGPTIEGGVQMTVTGTEDINAAVGDKACADQQMGTIGKKATC